MGKESHAETDTGRDQNQGKWRQEETKMKRNKGERREGGWKEGEMIPKKENRRRQEKETTGAEAERGGEADSGTPKPAAVR